MNDNKTAKDVLDAIMRRRSFEAKKAVIAEGYGLSILITNCQIPQRRYVAELGYGLDILEKDENRDVRESVAEYRKKHNKSKKIEDSKLKEADFKKIVNNLLHSSNYEVKKAFILEGYGLDVLTQDKDEKVRAFIAERGLYLNKLVNDESIIVKKAIIKQNYSLDTFIKDENPDIRREVALQGYGLDELINDSNFYVRTSAKAMMEKPSEKNRNQLDRLIDDAKKDILSNDKKIEEELDKKVENFFKDPFLIKDIDTAILKVSELLKIYDNNPKEFVDKMRNLAWKIDRTKIPVFHLYWNDDETGLYDMLKRWSYTLFEEKFKEIINQVSAQKLIDLREDIEKETKQIDSVIHYYYHDRQVHINRCAPYKLFLKHICDTLDNHVYNIEK